MLLGCVGWLFKHLHSRLTRRLGLDLVDLDLGGRRGAPGGLRLLAAIGKVADEAKEGTANAADNGTGKAAAVAAALLARLQLRPW